MLTPLDIHNMQFKKSLFGYSSEEVDRSLNTILRDYELLFKNNKNLQEQIQYLSEKLDEYKRSEDTLKQTMVLAEKVMDQEGSKAKSQADVIIKRAEIEAKGIIKHAEEEVLSLYSEVERLKLYEKQLYLKHKGFLEFQMQLLDGYRDELIEEPVETKRAKSVSDSVDYSEILNQVIAEEPSTDYEETREPIEETDIPKQEVSFATDLERAQETLNSYASRTYGIEPEEEDPVPIKPFEMPQPKEPEEPVTFEEVPLPEQPKEEPETVTEELDDMAKKLESALAALEAIYKEEDNK